MTIQIGMSFVLTFIWVRISDFKILWIITGWWLLNKVWYAVVLDIFLPVGLEGIHATMECAAGRVRSETVFDSIHVNHSQIPSAYVKGFVLFSFLIVHISEIHRKLSLFINSIFTKLGCLKKKKSLSIANALIWINLITITQDCSSKPPKRC